MRRLSALFLGLLLSLGAYADVWQAEYGVARTFDFKLYNTDGTLDVDEVDGGAEVTLDCDGTPATATNDFVDEGAFYSIALTAAELQCQRVTVTVAATDTNVFFIQTHGHASAFNATMGWNTGDSFARLGAPAGASVSADIATVDGNVDSVLVDTGTDIPARFDGVEGATFSSATDSLEAIRDRGDAAWTTGGAGGCNPETGCVADGTAQGATGTTIQLAAAEAFADDELIGAIVQIESATAGTGQARIITDYVGSTDTATVDTWTTTPTGTILYNVFSTPPAPDAGYNADVVAWNGTLLSTTNPLPNAAPDAAGGLVISDAGGLDIDALNVNVNDIETDTADMQPKLGTFPDLASGATLAGNLEDMRDDGTAVFSRTTDSLQAIADGGGGGPTAAQIVDEWETQSQADPTGFHVNVLEIGGTAQTANDNGLDINAILVDTNELQTDWVNGGRLDLIVDGILVDTAEIGAAGAGLTAADDAVMTRLGAPAGASVSADIAAVEAQTDDIGVAGAGLTAIPGIELLGSGTCDSGSTTTCVDAARTEADADYWRGVSIKFTSGTVSEQSRCIVDFNQTTDTITWVPATTQAVSTNTYQLIRDTNCVGVDPTYTP